jgi:hypothetical protein
MTDGSRKVFNYLVDNFGKEFTTKEIADALDLGGRVVSGSLNGLVRKEYAAKRVEEIPSEKEGGKPTIVRYFTLTEAGLSFDPDAEPVKKTKKSEDAE